MGNAECVMRDQSYDGSPLTCCIQREGWATGERPPAGFRLPPKTPTNPQGASTGGDPKLGPLFSKLITENRAEDEQNRSPGIPQQRRIELQKKRLELLRAQLEVERACEQKDIESVTDKLSTLSQDQPNETLSTCPPSRLEETPASCSTRHTVDPTDLPPYRKMDSLGSQDLRVQERMQQLSPGKPLQPPPSATDRAALRMFNEERQDVQVPGGESLRVKTWKDMDQPNDDPAPAALSSLGSGVSELTKDLFTWE